MTTLATDEKQWVDIVQPEIPAYAVDSWGIGVTVVVLLILAGLTLFLYLQPRLRAKRALHRVAGKLRGSRIDARFACQQIRQCLRSGLGLHRLRSAQWGDGDAEWQAYVDRLSAGCFAPAVPTRSELDGLLQEARVWLSRKAVVRR